MRPTTSFTLHAILAAALAALAATSAAAADPAYLKFGGVEGDTEASSDKPRIAVIEWSWNATGENVQGSQDIVITGSRIPQPNLTSASPVTAEGGLDAGMKQLEAKDRLGNTAAPGTLRIKAKMPWTSCEEGRRYSSLELNDGSQRVVLKNAVIASCGKAGVRGWDPKKKEAVTGKAEPR